MAQAQAVQTISHTESLELVRCLLRVSVFHVTAMRGLFPDSFYKDVVMKNLDGMSIKVLSPKDDESKRLVDWIEGGVYDAVKRGYLKSLLFGISTNAEGTELLEEYVYNFTYGADGALKMDIALNGGKGGSKNPALLKGNKVTVNNVRYQVTRLMRMLVQLCKTLEKVPSERYLFCRLVYHDNTPDDYEPQYFRSMDSSSELGHFAKKPFTMNVGAISTEHHQVGLRLKSILDACDVEEGEADAVEEEASGEGPSETEDEGQDNCQEDESCEGAQNNHLEASDARRGRNNSTPLRMKAKADLEDLVMTEPQDQDMIQSQQQRDGKAAVKLESENTKRLRAAGADIVPARVNLQAGDQNHYSRLSAVAVRSGAVSPEPADHQQVVEAGGVVQQLQGGDVSALKPTKALISDPALQPAALLEADIRDWCLSRSQVDVEDVMSNFIQVSAATATKMLSMFHKEGLLQATSRKYSFKVVKKEGTVRDSALASHMGSLLVGPRAQNPLYKSGGAGGMKGAATDQGMEHHEGSDITMAPSDANNEGGDNGMSVDEVRSKRAAAAVHAADHVTSMQHTGGQHMPTLDQDAPANNVFYDASQQSGRLRPSKVRKVSYVAEPIHQTKKNTKGTAVATAAATTPPGSSRSRLGRMRR